MVRLSGDKPLDSLRIFTTEGEVRMVFFCFENVVFRDNDENESSFELLAHLHKQALTLLFPQRFTVDVQKLNSPLRPARLSGAMGEPSRKVSPTMRYGSV